MSRSFAWGLSWSAVVGTFGLGAVALGLSPGCAGEAPLPDTSGYRGDAAVGNGLEAPPGPCEPGATRRCGATLGANGEKLSCFEGVNECVGGHWTECRNGTEVERPAPPAPGSPGAQTMSLSTATACATNPCDPRCQQWIERPDGGFNVQYEGAAPVIPDAGLPLPWTQGSYTKYPAGVGTKQPCAIASDCQVDTRCVSPTAGSCAHSQCATGAALASTCNACVTAICAELPTCCSGSWTQQCVDDVATVCGAECTPGANPGDPPLTDGTCEPWYGGQTDPTCTGYDLTVGPTCTDGIPVCNRGQGFSPRGVTISIYPASQFSAPNPTGATATCTIAQGIRPGWCTTVKGCGTPAAGDTIIVNDPQPSSADGGLGPECRTDNDRSIYEPGTCSPPICSSNGSSASTKAINLFFMVDQSKSMVCSTSCDEFNPQPTPGAVSRWSAVTAALKTFLSDPNSAGIHVAFRLFPDVGSGGCTGTYGGGGTCSVSACATPAVEGNLDWPIGNVTSPCSGSADPTECSIFTILNGLTPQALNTPSSAALQGAVDWAKLGKQARPDEEFAVVLVTDGDPSSCDTNVSNIAAIAQGAFQNDGVKTYVVGVEGVSNATCTQIATAGGGQCFPISAANGSTTAQAVAAFQTIAATSTSCDFPLPNAGSFDPSLAAVTYTGASPPSFTAACRPDETFNSANGTCYYALGAGYPWSTARDLCRGMGNGWHLAKIDDAAENTFVRGLTATSNEIWLAGDDSVVDGTWTWWDGSPIASGASSTYSNWALGAPSVSTAKNCLSMGGSGTWTDVDCAAFTNSIGVCEGPKEGDTSTLACPVGQLTGPEGNCYLIDTTPRTWNEAFANCQSLGLDLVNVSSSATNFFVSQQLAGTEAWINLRNDQGTWTRGDATTVYDSTVSGCRANETSIGSQCYKLSTAGTWFAAQGACGCSFDLAKIENSAQNTAIQGMLNGNGTTDAWIGANDQVNESAWVWASDGTQFYTSSGCRTNETAANGSCYYVGTTATPYWQTAQNDCAANHNGNLVEIDSAAENATVKTLMGAATSAWIGASDKAAEGQWVWTGGTEFWTGKGCPSGTKALSGSCYSNNGGGSLSWTNAKNACHNLATGGLTWRLTTVDSDAENSWLVANYPPATALWIGGFRTDCPSCTDPLSRWSPPYAQWDSGAAWGYTHWDTGQPDTYNDPVCGPENRTFMRPNGFWNDDCDPDAFPYVCEAKGPGTPVNGAYSNWAAISPATNTLNNCGVITSTGTWADKNCSGFTNRIYVCERASTPVAGTYSNWATSQPGIEDCGVMSNSGTWSAQNCTATTMPGVCEGPQLGSAGPIGGAYNNWGSCEPAATMAVARIGAGGLWYSSTDTAKYPSVCAGPPTASTVPATLSPVSSASACATSGQFYFDDPSNPSSLTLCNKACSAVQADRHARLNVELQCKPTKNVPLPPGYPKALTTVHAENYAPTCPTGQAAVWQFLAYNTNTPGDSTIDFDARVGTDATTLGAAPWKPLTTVSAASNNEVCSMTSACLVDVFAMLGTPDNNAPLLDLRMTLHPGTKNEAPEVIDWRLTYTCKDNQ